MEEIDNIENNEKELDELKELVNADKLDTTTSMNILINAVQASYDKDHFNDVDRYLIYKSLNCFKELVELGEDIVIKVK